MITGNTKAKRRVTLSLCGLGWLDETEVDTITDARPAVVNTETGEIVGNGAKAAGVSDVAEAKAEFIVSVLKTIPYYRHENHVISTLKELGQKGYSIEREPSLMLALQVHANAAANADAVASETLVLNDLVNEGQEA